VDIVRWYLVWDVWGSLPCDEHSTRLGQYPEAAKNVNGVFYHSKFPGG